MGEARTQRASRVFVFRVNRCKTLDILKMFGGLVSIELGQVIWGIGITWLAWLRHFQEETRYRCSLGGAYLNSIWAIPVT